MGFIMSTWFAMVAIIIFSLWLVWRDYGDYDNSEVFSWFNHLFDDKESDLDIAKYVCMGVTVLMLLVIN